MEASQPAWQKMSRAGGSVVADSYTVMVAQVMSFGLDHCQHILNRKGKGRLVYGTYHAQLVSALNAVTPEHEVTKLQSEDGFVQHRANPPDST